MLKKILQHSIAKNMFALGLLQVANYIVPLLAWPLLAKTLGVEQFGLVMMLLAICAMANILTDFGFNISATHLIAQDANNKEKIGQLLGNVFFIKGILAVVAGVIASIYSLVQLIPTSNASLDVWTIILLNLVILAQAFHCIWFFQGIEKMKHITTANILAKVAYVVLLFMVLPFYQHINLVLICFLLSQLCITTLFFISIYQEKYYILRPKLGMLWSELKYSFSFFVSRVAVSVYTLANTLILGHFNGSAVAGLYGSAEKVYGAGIGIAGIVSQALFPYVTKTNNLKLLVKIIMGMTIPVFVGCYILSIFSEEIIIFLFGEGFREASTLLELFLLLLCITFISVNIGYPGFSAIRKVQWANYTVMIGAVFHLLGLWMLYLLDLVNAKNVLLMIIFTESVILLLRVLLLTYFSQQKL